MLSRRLIATCCAAGLAFQSANANERVPVQTASLSTPITDGSSVKNDAVKNNALKNNALKNNAVKPDALKSALEELDGLAAREFQIETLQSIIETLATVDDYTAELTKQERVGGDLSKESRIELKFRHADDDAGISNGIYMKWLSGDRGREVIYVDGENSGKLLVHAGGWRARILPVLALDPTGTLAMGESRHPITNAGLLNLTQKWLDVRNADADRESVSYEVIPTDFDGVSAHKFVVVYGDRAESDIYRKCELVVDTERNIPLAAVNYTWDTAGNSDEQTLVERYEYRDIKLNAGLTDIDFDKSNRQYSFRK